MKKKSAFTLVEIMIVVVIIGLLAAMAIPAFQKVKYNAIEREVKKGVIVSSSDWEFYYKMKMEKEKKQKDGNEIIIPPQEQIQKVEVERKIENKKVIRIDGKLYEITPLE